MQNSSLENKQPDLQQTDVSGLLLPNLKPMKGCGVCGSKMVWIRGKYPKAPKRKICPTCAWERLEQINEISQPNYGQAYKQQ